MREGHVLVETGTSICSSNLSPSPSCETSSPQPGAPSPQHGDHRLSLSHHHLRVGAIPSGWVPSPQRGRHPLIEHPTRLPHPRRAEEGREEPESPLPALGSLPSPQAPPLPARRREGAGPGGAGGSQRGGGGAAPFPHCAALSRPGRVSSAPAPAPLPQRSRGGEEGGGCSPGPVGPLRRRPGHRGPCRGPRKEPGERVCGVSLPPPLVSFALKFQLEQGGERVSLLLLFICVLFYEGVRCLATWVAA